MSQHDFDIANGSGATVRGDINDALEALVTLSSGSSAPSTTYPYQLWADTTNGLLKQRNAANTAWEVRGTLAETMAVSRSSNTILGAGDHGKFFVATATFTQTLTAAATLGDGWYCHYRVNSGAVVTFDPNSSENIDGAASKVVNGPASGVIFCDGSAFHTYGFDSPAASDTVAGVIEVATQAEMEAGSSTTLAVTPGRIGYHPSVAKAWCNGNFSGNVHASYNVSSVTDLGNGSAQVNLTVPFSSVNYCAVATIDASATALIPVVRNMNTGSFVVVSANIAGAATDGDAFHTVAFGDVQ